MTVNSLMPSKLVDVGVVEVRLISDKAGVTPTTIFPNTSVTLEVYFTIVEVLADVRGVKLKL